MGRVVRARGDQIAHVSTAAAGAIDGEDDCPAKEAALITPSLLADRIYTTL